MEDYHIISDIPASAKFHSCIISSFAFDYYFFDIQIRRYLHKKGIYNIIILCDSHMLDESINAISYRAKHIFKDYSIVPVESKGCFHPKLFAFVGNDQLMLHVGSGNLTNGGMGKNHELFSTFSCSSVTDPQFAIVKNGIDYLVDKIQNTKGFVTQQLSWIKEHCNLISGFESPVSNIISQLTLGSSCRMLFNSTTSIYQQVFEYFDPAMISSIKLVSPFFDSDGRLITKLLQDYPNAVLEIFVQNDIPAELSMFVEESRVQFYDWSLTQRGKKSLRGYSSENERRLHAKVFIFETAQEIHLLHGSANATSAAFGLNSTIINDEVMLLYSFETKSDLPDIGLSPAVDVSQIRHRTNQKELPNPESRDRQTHNLNKVLGVDKFNSKIILYLKIGTGKGLSVSFCDLQGQVLRTIAIAEIKDQITYTFKDYPSIRNTVSVFLCIDGSRSSNNGYVNDVEYLHKGNPSKENQRLQRLLSTIMLGNMSEFDILSHLSLIMNQSNLGPKSSRKSISGSGVLDKQVSISYEESKALMESEALGEDDVLFSSSRKLLDAINAIVQISKMQREEQEMNQDEAEEKDGGQEEDLDHNKSMYVSKPFSSERKLLNQQKKIVKLYDSYLQMLAKQTYLRSDLITDKYITSSDLSYFIVLYLQLLHMAGKPYQIKGEEGNPQQILLSSSTLSYQQSFTSISIKLIGHILLYLNSYEFKSYKDDFARQDLDNRKEQLALLLNFGLGLHHHLLPNHEVWIKSLLLNTDHTLPSITSESIKLVSKRLPDISMDIPSDLAEVISNLKEKETHTRNYEVLLEVGLVEVVEYIPNETEALAMKISMPGIGYNEKKQRFEYPKVFSNKRERWFLRKGAAGS